MGTNYYWEQEKRNYCEHCGRDDAKIIHIGKSSMGWTFSFHGTDEIRSFSDWKKEFEKGGKIIDEYGVIIPVHQFLDFVERKKKELLNHQVQFPSDLGCWLDDEGNSFSSYEFF